MNTPLTDAQIVQKIKENPDNYALIIDRFEVPIMRYIGRLTGAHDEEIQEITQTVFIKAYRSINGFDTTLKLSSWLYRIAHNVSVDYLRKNNRKKHASLDADDEESIALIEKIASSENVSLQCRQDAEKKGVRDIMQKLSENHMIVLWLYFMEDKSYEDISDILQIPIGTVGTLLSRAKKQFIALAQEPQFSHLFVYV